MKKKIYLLVSLLLLVIACLFIFPEHENVVRVYDNVLYYPLQFLRDILFGFIPFSFGDVLYVAGGIWLLHTIVKWVKYIIRFNSTSQKLAASIINTINVALAVYLWFVLGWGANYYKLPMRETWQLRAHKDTLELVPFDSILVDRLNALAPAYRPLSFSEINKISKDNYRRYTDSKVKKFGLNVKPTLYEYFMDRVAIEGYYNPFTGEGQVVEGLPAFMLPFTVGHEMAHQAGIAAEGDANLMSYALGTMSTNLSFNYSANLELWIYVNARLYRKDSVRALAFEHKLNRLTRAHLDTIDQLNKISDNDARKYSNQVYDNYLKMQQQKDGIRSYGNVTTNAWLLEKKRLREPQNCLVLKMP